MILSSGIPSFRCFIEQAFHLRYRLRAVSDGRSDAEIGAPVVAEALVFLGSLGLGSLLRCDQMLRSSAGVGWFGRGGVVSDTTMARSLESMDLTSLHTLLADSYRLGRNQGLSKCPLRGGKLRLGLVDGSDLGHFRASALEVIGIESFFAGLEPYEGQTNGKELPASYALLRRIRQQFGSSFVDMMLGDALYLNQHFFRLCLEELGCDALVKTRDFTRDIAIDALGLFTDASVLADTCQHLDRPGQVVSVEGFDSEQMCAYRTLMTSSFHLNGLDVPLQVAWVRESHVYPSRQKKLKDNKKGSGFCNEDENEFLVVASCQHLARPLTAEEMRQLAHWRWDQENDGFKAANQHVKTKRLYSHDPNAKMAILLMLLVTFNLMSIYLHRYGRQLTDFPGMKQTKLFQLEMMRIYCYIWAFLDAFHHR